MIALLTLLHIRCDFIMKQTETKCHNNYAFRPKRQPGTGALSRDEVDLAEQTSGTNPWKFSQDLGIWESRFGFRLEIWGIEGIWRFICITIW